MKWLQPHLSSSTVRLALAPSLALDPSRMVSDVGAKLVLTRKTFEDSPIVAFVAAEASLLAKIDL